MTSNPDPRMKEINARIEEKKIFVALPKCDLCGSQLREEDGKCICIRYIVKEKEE